MGRPIYPHELTDSDFAWLVNSFKENNPDSFSVDSTCLPIVLFREGVRAVGQSNEYPAPDPGSLPPHEEEDTPDADLAE